MFIYLCLVHELLAKKHVGLRVEEAELTSRAPRICDA